MSGVFCTRIVQGRDAIFVLSNCVKVVTLKLDRIRIGDQEVLEIARDEWLLLSRQLQADHLRCSEKAVSTMTKTNKMQVGSCGKYPSTPSCQRI